MVSAITMPGHPRYIADMPDSPSPLVAVVMGSASDWPTMKHTADLLERFGVPYEAKVLSAHRMPVELGEFGLAAADRGLRAIIAGAGGAAHLPGMLAAHTRIPVLGVPVQSKALSGLDSLLSIVQMPAGVPVATLAIGEAGAKNAALLAVAMLATTDAGLAKKLDAFRKEQTQAARSAPLQ
jgi:5-(carboxyamino)imidazole ribonucleotide mutase